MASLKDLAANIGPMPSSTDNGGPDEFIIIDINSCDRDKNFENFIRDNLWYGLTTVFKYDGNKIIVKQEYYSGKKFTLKLDTASCEVRISIPEPNEPGYATCHSIARVLSYSRDLEGLYKAYHHVRFGLRRKYFERVDHSYLPGLGFRVELNFNLVPLGTRLVNKGDMRDGYAISNRGVVMYNNPSEAPTLSEQYERGEVDYKRFELPLRLKDGATDIFGEKYLAERICVRGEYMTVDFYHDMSRVDDGCKYDSGLSSGMNNLITHDFVNNLQTFVAVNGKFRGGHFVVLLTCGERVYLYVTKEDKTYDVTALVEACQVRVDDISSDLGW